MEGKPLENSKRQTGTNSPASTLARREVCLMLILGLLIGCGGPRVHKVNPEIARRTLIHVLDHWQAGETAESLRNVSPEIVVQDFDWAGGVKLTGYELQGDGEARDANLAISVKLSLVSSSGQKSTKVVRYLVGTAPVLTVFRDMF